MTCARSGGGAGLVPFPEPAQPFRVVEVGGERCAELLVVAAAAGRGSGWRWRWRIRVRHATRRTSSMRGPQCRWRRSCEKIDDDVVHDQVVVVAGERVEAWRRPGWSGSMRTSRSAIVAGSRSRTSSDQVALGVDDDDAAAGVDVVEDHVEQQGGLAGAGGAEHVHVLAGVGDLQRRPRGRRPAARPRTLVPRPPVGTATGAGMGLARARSRPGTATSCGSAASAASSAALAAGTRAAAAARARRRTGSVHPQPAQPVAAGADPERGRDAVGEGHRAGRCSWSGSASRRVGVGDGVADGDLPQGSGCGVGDCARDPGHVPDRCPVAADAGAARPGRPGTGEIERRRTAAVAAASTPPANPTPGDLRCASASPAYASGRLVRGGGAGQDLDAGVLAGGQPAGGLQKGPQRVDVMVPAQGVPGGEQRNKRAALRHPAPAAFGHGAPDLVISVLVPGQAAARGSRDQGRGDRAGDPADDRQASAVPPVLQPGVGVAVRPAPAAGCREQLGQGRPERRRPARLDNRWGNELNHRAWRASRRCRQRASARAAATRTTRTVRTIAPPATALMAGWARTQWARGPAVRARGSRRLLRPRRPGHVVVPRP